MATYPSHSAAVPARTLRRRKIVVAASLASVLFLPIAAYAAVQIFGFGSFDSVAATSTDLRVNRPALVGTLRPGVTVGAKGLVTNPNTFPIVVTGVILKNSSLAVTPNVAGCLTTVHAVGSAATWPGPGGGAGTRQALARRVTIAAGASAWVLVPRAVRQDAAATMFCGVRADFAVVAASAR